LQRTIIKKLVLTALNARDKKTAFASFRDGFPAGHMAKGITNEELVALLGAFTQRTRILPIASVLIRVSG